MIHPVLIGGVWRAADATRTFCAVNPANGEALPDDYPVSGAPDLEAALAASVAARTPGTPEQIAAFLEGYAARLEADADALVERAALETALPAGPRLRDTELPRTTRQLRLAAHAARTRSWTRPTLDTESGLASMLQPLGAAVVIFGPNNFPFAFNAVSGGDFAAAIAAGNPVIAKGHPAHPGTTRLLAEHARAALGDAGLHPATVQLIYDVAPELGLAVMADGRLGAAAFTGSRGAGLALKAAADTAGLPFYAEMSSVNPVVLLPGALEERGEAIAAELFAANTLGAGQFCTNPGLVISVQGPGHDRFMDALTSAYHGASPGILLTGGGVTHAEQGLQALTAAGAQVLTGGTRADPGFRLAPALLSVDAGTFQAHPAELQREVFGPTCLIVETPAAQLPAVLALLEGGLTAAVYSSSTGGDDGLYTEIEPVLRVRAGRLLNDRMPTGVAVSSAQQHGGAYPASSHPGFTAVGLPAAVTRFAALRAYDHVRDDRLPPELQRANPLGLQRLVDGTWQT